MPVLEVKNLSTWFHTRNGIVKAVDDVSFSLEAGQTLGVVGESGSGKSVCCYSLLGLIPSPPGQIEQGEAWFEGQDLLKLDDEALRLVRGNAISMIFQDPMTCLNPFLTVGEQLVEPIIHHNKGTRAEARERAIDLLQEVGIRDHRTNFDAYPHEFSGGMRQRVMIAMALIADPKILIADEPTTALDVTIQKQILGLLAALKTKRNLSLIFISHDLSVVANIVDHVIVMKTGKVVEQGPVRQLFESPQHEYTQELLAAVPSGPKTADSAVAGDALVDVEHVTTSFRVEGQKERFVAVNDVSFEIQRGEILGLVGESGSGKSTLGRTLLNLVPAQSGGVRFDGDEITQLDARAMLPYRRRMQLIFQDPYASLNPRMTIYDALAEPMLLHGIAAKATLDANVLALMDDVGLARAFVRKYPHEFSGGQRQRIAIGRAIATKPEFVVADEPVSALDVTIQRQILNLLLSLVESHNLTMLFISHDLAVVRYLCDRVLVMKSGKILESGATEQVYAEPADPYTQSLMASSTSIR